MLFNKTTGKELMVKSKLAKTHWEKMKGLMFEDFKKFDYALIFVLPRESLSSAAIHMLFVFFPIDLIYLNKGKKVVDIARNVQPFSLGYSPKKPSKFFVELPAGKALGVKIGHELEW